MNIDLPRQSEEAARRFFSLDGTPVIIDFIKDSDDDTPTAAYRLGTDKGGFLWRPLEEDLFLETFRDGKEVELFDFVHDVIPAFTDSRANDHGHGGVNFDMMG